MEGGCIITFTGDYFIFYFLHKVIIIIIIKNPVKISKKGKTNLKEHIIYGTHVLPENRQKYTNTVN
jgi:hypothetical protein